MEKIIIPNTNFQCSKFIFGTGSLLNILSKKKRLKLLNSAVDKNFSHFDTSPYYGFGQAETNLREILKKNQNLTITTKVGLYPPGRSNQSLLEMIFRKSFGKFLPFLAKPNIDFTIKKANKSLEESLKRLGRDCIDILLIHEPIIELINTEEWKKWFGQLIKEGKIRYFGLSSLAASRLEKCIVKDNKLFNILQTLDSVDLMEADFLKKNNFPLQITHGYMASSKKRYPEKSYKDIFNQILKRNPDGAIIISTRSQKHLTEFSNLLKNL